MVIYTLWDILSVFGYGYLAGILTIPATVLIFSSIRRGERRK